MEKKGATGKASPRRQLDPETEKRLLGNLKPTQKKRFALTDKPPRIDHIEVRMTLPAPKAAENLSKLSSVETFCKNFFVLENQIKLLHQLSCPPDSEKIFESVAEIASNITNFQMHCKTIAKQKKLKAEISQKSYSYFKDFLASFQLFSDKLLMFGTQLHHLYELGITQLFETIDECERKFFETSYRDPQSRSISQQYRKYCDDSLDEIQSSLIHFLGDEDFSTFSKEELQHLSEKTKTFGRFFEKELSPAVSACLPPNLSVIKYVARFHDNFTAIVPLITSAPEFVSKYNEILSFLDTTKQSIVQIQKEIGDEKVLFQKKKRSSCIVLGPDKASAEDEEDNNDLKQIINNLAKLFKVPINEDDDNVTQLQNIYSQATTKLKENITTIHELESKLSDQAGITKEEYKSQFSAIRKFKTEIEEKIQDQNAMFNRSLIYSIKALLPNPQIDTNASYTRQVQSITTQLKEFIDQSQNQIDELKDEQAKTRSLFRQTSTNNEEPLHSFITKAMEEMNNENRKLKEKLQSFDKEIIETKTNFSNSIETTFGLNANDLQGKSLVELVKFVQTSLTRVTQEIKRNRLESANILTSFIATRDAIAKLINMNSSSNEYEGVKQDFDSIIQNLQTKRSNSVIFQQNVYVFLIKLIDALQLPNILTPQATQEDIVNCLFILSNKLDNPHETASEIMNSSPSKGLFLNASEYKSLALDVCSRLLKPENDSLEGRIFADIKKDAIQHIEELEETNAMTLFSDLVPKNDLSKKPCIKLMGDLHEEIQEARQNNILLKETHSIICSINQQISSKEMEFIPNSPQLIALNACTAHLEKLNTSTQSIANIVIKDIAELNSYLCQQISEGKFIAAHCSTP